MPNPSNDVVIDSIMQALYAAKADAWDMGDKAALLAAIHQVIAPKPSVTMEEEDSESIESQAAKHAHAADDMERR